jgi:crotonobetainyl-CoA:carnitine CoA-transferase CaiB-like acyl-CoA transferase
VKPLEHLTVADLSGTIATCYCAKLLADYGAQVFNLEPEDGFQTRIIKPFIPGTTESALHGYLNTNKKSVRGADQTDWAQVDLILYDQTLTQLNETQLNTNSSAISWFGKSGPYKNFKGSDAMIQSLIGQLRGIGPPEGPPIIPTGYQAQIIGGLTAYVGSLGQLLGNSLNDHTELFHLDTSIYEANLCLTDPAILHANNQIDITPRLGINRFAPTFPLGVFPCQDGWLGITVLSPSQWEAFCKLLDLTQLSDTPLFHSSMERLEAADLIEPLIIEKLAEHSAEDLFYRGQQAKIPLARVPTMDELFEVDQYVMRNAFSQAVQAGHQYQVPSVPFRLFKTPPNFGGPVSNLGEDTATWQNLIKGSS